jgi:UDP-N-acetylglucosamine--N-acetylmuramyl-(pentapeptide) pyrophosphoryl-undecaprenol N-acetylglucosamine transferase
MSDPSKPLTILLTGGGTGGHITPILAVAHELKRQQPDAHVIYVGERGGKFEELTSDHAAIDQVYRIRAGKYRRYHGESAIRRLVDVRTNLLNVRDLFYFLIGTIQGWFLLGRVKPDVVLLKGGFVGVPVGLAAAGRGLKFVTHDSDAIPGLANRFVGRWAKMHAVALPAEEYKYPAKSTVQVGVLLEPDFKQVDEAEQGAFKQRLGIDPSRQVLLVTGSSSGAQRLNEAVVKIIDKLLTDYSNLFVVHQVGKGKLGVYGDYRHERLMVVEFMRPMYVYTGASDVVVSRCSANNIAELGAQAKPVIAVPSPFLAGGHQLKNAERLAQQQAALVVQETAQGTDVQALEAAIRALLTNAGQRKALAERLHEITIANAAQRLAGILLDLAKTK